MKKILLILITLTIFVSCKKRKEIIYPITMTHGDNVLAIDNISMNNDYSFGAKLGKKATLKIVITNLSVQPSLSQPKPSWFYSSSNGWTVSSYGLDDTQTFTSNADGEIILKINFSGSPGSCKIDYYENSSSVSKTKNLNW